MKKVFLILFLGLSYVMQAQTTVNAGLTVTAQQSVDGKGFKLSSGKHVPYLTSTEFLTTIPSTRRHIGQIAYVTNGSLIETWQFVGGIADVNFKKVNSGAAVQVADTVNKWVGNVERKTDSLIVYKGTNRDAYYVPSSSGDFIPLSGTEVGKPVTGTIERLDVFMPYILKYSEIPTHYYIDTDPEGYGYGIFGDDDGGENFSLRISPRAVRYISTDTASEGFTSDSYFPNKDSLAYAQMQDVGWRGTATLVAGTVTVTTDKIQTGWKIYVSVNSPSGTQGFLSAPTSSIVNETSFVINSSSNTETSTVNWWIAP